MHVVVAVVCIFSGRGGTFVEVREAVEGGSRHRQNDLCALGSTQIVHAAGGFRVVWKAINQLTR